MTHGSNRLLRLMVTCTIVAVMQAFGPEPVSATDETPILDLRALHDAGKLPAKVDTTTKDDIVYERSKRYRGYRLDDILDAYPGLEALKHGGAEIIFTADDGYVAAMALDKALAADGLIAVRDLDAPAGEDWVPFKQGKKTITPAPFYLVWPDQDIDDWTYVWPYQLATIAIEPFDKAFGASVPTGADANVRDGYYVFKIYCLQCHSMNLVGGEQAPELNVPQNITEYWKRDVLRAFIRDVPSFRAGSNMPSFAELLRPEDIELTLDYLAHMATQKVCSDAETCAAMVE